MKFQPGNPGGPGRPRGRIAKLRETMGELSKDGSTIAAKLHEIITDPTSTKKEVIDAASLYLGYLVGKPEAAVAIEADIQAGPRVDTRTLLSRLPTELVDRVVAELDGDDPPLLPPGDDDGHG